MFENHWATVCSVYHLLYAVFIIYCMQCLSSTVCSVYHLLYAVFIIYCMQCLSSTQAGSRFCTNLFVFMKGHGCLEHHRNFRFTRILLHFANSLRIILAFLRDHCGAGL